MNGHWEPCAPALHQRPVRFPAELRRPVKKPGSDPLGGWPLRRARPESARRRAAEDQSHDDSGILVVAAPRSGGGSGGASRERPAHRHDADAERRQRGHQEVARSSRSARAAATPRRPTRRASSSQRDPFRSIRRGRQLFQRKFTVAQGLGPRTNDGDRRHHGGRVARRRTRPTAAPRCHGRPRGSAGFGGDVFTRPDSRDAPHLFGLGLQEMLADEITRDLRAIRERGDRAGRSDAAHPVTLALQSKGIAYGPITRAPGRHASTRPARRRASTPTCACGRSSRTAGRSRSASSSSARSTTRWGSSRRIPTSLAASGGGASSRRRAWCSTARSTRIEPARRRRARRPTRTATASSNEIDPALVDHMEFYLLNYFKPGTGAADARTPSRAQELLAERRLHDLPRPDLTIDHDRRVADVETVFDPAQRHLQPPVRDRDAAVHDGRRRLRLPGAQGPVAAAVRRARASSPTSSATTSGPAFHERNFDGTIRTQFMTEPLWGVGLDAALRPRRPQHQPRRR